MDTIATFAPIYRRPAANGDEQAAFSRTSRRALAIPGVTRKIKSRAARRDRHDTARALRAYAG